MVSDEVQVDICKIIYFKKTQTQINAVHTLVGISGHYVTETAACVLLYTPRILISN